jgi:hypothetical protein
METTGNLGAKAVSFLASVRWIMGGIITQINSNVKLKVEVSICQIARFTLEGSQVAPFGRNLTYIGLPVIPLAPGLTAANTKTFVVSWSAGALPAGWNITWQEADSSWVGAGTVHNFTDSPTQISYTNNEEDTFTKRYLIVASVREGTQLSSRLY